MSILGRKISIKVVVAMMVLMVMLALLPVMTKSPEHEVTLVARDMAFFLENDATIPNPVIDVKAGETVRMIIRNQERGMLHDFAVPAVDAATNGLHWNEQTTLTFDAPRTPGTYEYICRSHSLMMKGTLRVTQ